jgi:hypothetical protein
MLIVFVSQRKLCMGLCIHRIFFVRYVEKQKYAKLGFYFSNPYFSKFRSVV